MTIDRGRHWEKTRTEALNGDRNALKKEGRLFVLLLRMNVIATLQSIDFKVAATAKSCRESESESRSSKVDCQNMMENYI